MDLSVVIPVYNKEQYLEDCLKSILCQTKKDIEVIIIDDGSTDKSGQICDDYAISDKRVRVFHQVNSGPILARKRGIEESMGDYITFVDADDLVKEDSFSFAEKYIKQGIDIICFAITRYGNGWEQDSAYRFREGVYSRYEITNEIFPQMIWHKESGFGIDPSLCTKIINKSIIKQAYDELEDTSFHYGEDMAVVYNAISKANTLCISNISYYLHRQKEKGNRIAYFEDKLFFVKLFRLYCVLRNQFIDYPIIIEQIDSFYVYSIQFRERCVSNKIQQVKYLFPFDKVNKGDRIVLYGAGDIGKEYYEELSLIEYCRVVLWVDKDYLEIADDRIKNPQEITNTEYDTIVIAIKNEKTKESVVKYLCGIGVPRDIIVK